jgi:hypothetical protein
VPLVWHLEPSNLTRGFAFLTTFHLIVQASSIKQSLKKIHVVPKDIDGRPLFYGACTFRWAYHLRSCTYRRSNQADSEFLPWCRDVRLPRLNPRACS